MSLSSKDIVVTFVAFGVIGASSFALYRDFVATSSVSQEKIGTITYKKKKAERKFSSRATWEGLSQSSPVYNHDSIKTAESASATINLNDGTVLDLDENTLVVLAINKGEAAVDVGSGSLFANGQGSSALTVRAKGNTITTKKGSLSLSLDKDDVKLRMVSGGASVAATGGTQTVSGDEALHLSGGKFENEKDAAILESPAPSSFIVITKGKTADVKFSWKGDVTAPILSISTNRSMSKSEKIKITGNSGMKALPAGEYFWTVSSSNGEGSDIRKFVVINDTEIRPLSPKDEKYSSVDAIPAIALRWSEGKFASAYEVEVSRDRTFTDVVKKIQLKNTSIAFDPQGDGEYFWRVRGIYPDGSVGTLSDAASFSLSHVKALPQPDLVYPSAEEKIGIAALDRGIQFVWRAVDGASGYRIEVARDTHFAQAVTVDTRGNNALIRNKLDAGVYYWRVMALSQEGHSSGPSDLRTFELVRSLPISLYPAQVDPVEGVIFSWKDENNASRYRLEISRDASFSSTIYKSEETSRRVTVSGLPDDELFWRVSPLDMEGAAILTSSISSVRVYAVLEMPTAISPVKNISLDIAHMDKIEFKWKPVKGASAYRIEIFKNSFIGDKKVFETDLPDNVFAFNKFSLLSNGNFYWQVRALRKVGTTVDKMSPASKEYFMIPSGPALSAPKVGTIKVYVE